MRSLLSSALHDALPQTEGIEARELFERALDAARGSVARRFAQDVADGGAAVLVDDQLDRVHRRRVRDLRLALEHPDLEGHRRICGEQLGAFHARTLLRARDRTHALLEEPRDLRVDRALLVAERLLNRGVAELVREAIVVGWAIEVDDVEACPC